MGEARSLRTLDPLLPSTSAPPRGDAGGAAAPSPSSHPRHHPEVSPGRPVPLGRGCRGSCPRTSLRGGSGCGALGFRARWLLQAVAAEPSDSLQLRLKGFLPGYFETTMAVQPGHPTGWEMGCKTAAGSGLEPRG